MVDFALRMSILNNVVGPCGQEGKPLRLKRIWSCFSQLYSRRNRFNMALAPAGPWADGLSIAGRDSIVVSY